MAQLKPLTGLRFAAALWVVFFHFHTFSTVARGDRASTVMQGVLHNIMASGFAGVNFFFILSGFILAYTYVDSGGRLRTSHAQFWVARFARIYPVYLCAFLLAAVPFMEKFGAGSNPISICTGSGPVVGNNPLVTGLATVTLVQSWLPCSSILWNPPGWSLSVEIVFYLCFPFMALPIARLTNRGLYMALGLLWLACLVAPFIYLIVSPDGFNYDGVAPYHGYWQFVVRYNPLLRLPEFLMGVALSQLFVRRTAHTLAWPWSPGVLSVLSAIVILVLVATRSLLRSMPEPLSLFSTNMFIENGLLDPLFALLIFSLALNQGPLAWFFSRPALILLGEASYALYIIHYPMWQWMGLAVQNLHWLGASSFLQSNVYFLIYLTVIVSLSVLSARRLEPSTRRAIKKGFEARIIKKSISSTKSLETV